jgi:DNA-binding response OmpR family regulator
MTKSTKQMVLVVDDSPFEREYLSTLLTNENRYIIQCASGEEAIEILKGFEVALILLDVQLEGISGLKTARKLHENPKTKDIPIIFITGQDTQTEHMFEGYDAGAVDYLVKPVEPMWLKSKVDVFCRLSQLRKVVEDQLTEIQEKNDELNRQLEEIQVLRGFIPICASCKMVRDDSGFWQNIEHYICDHSGAEFSHSLCPGCTDKLYPELNEYREGVKESK